MALKLGVIDITKAYLGSTLIEKAYLGSTVVLESGVDLLLDLYQNAAAAYSLRKLKSTYTGDVISVRRTNNDVANIGFSGNELDIATLLAFANGTNVFVSDWYDQSGLGNHATQITASSQPQIVSNGSLLLENGEPTIFFDGVDDVLNTSNLIHTTNNILGCSVATTTSLTGSLALFSQNDFFVSPIGRSTLLNIESNTLKGSFFFNNGNSYTAISADSIIATEQFLMLNYSTSDDYYASLNGSAGNLGVTNQVFTPSGRYASIGGTPAGVGFFEGSIQEVVVWDNDKSSNKIGIETNINDFYNIY